MNFTTYIPKKGLDPFLFKFGSCSSTEHCANTLLPFSCTEDLDGEQLHHPQDVLGWPTSVLNPFCTKAATGYAEPWPLPWALPPRMLWEIHPLGLGWTFQTACDLQQLQITFGGWWGCSPTSRHPAPVPPAATRGSEQLEPARATWVHSWPATVCVITSEIWRPLQIHPHALHWSQCPLGESGFQGGTTYVKYGLRAAFLWIWFSSSGKDNCCLTQRRQAQHVEHLWGQ